MNACANIIVNGMVQGVGFRYFVHTRATKLGLNGIVKNNSDGSVAIEAEGERSLIEEFIKEIKIGPRFANVGDVKIEWQSFSNRFRSFEIK